MDLPMSSCMDITLPSSKKLWWGKQYVRINVQQQTLVGQTVWTYHCPAAENLGGASSMDILMSSSRPWWGKQYGLINVQQQKTLVGQAVWTYQCPAVWTYQCPAAENLGGASSMDISMFRSRLLVGQAVWTFHCSGADFWWGKQYGHTGVQNAGGHSGADRLAASMHGHLLGFDGAKVPADGQTLQVSVLGYLWHQCLQVSIKICPHKSHE